MEHENFIIEIEGQEISDLYEDLISLDVELDEELAGMFRLQFVIMREREDGAWTCLDDERLMIWKRVVINAGFVEGDAEELISGPITRVRPFFDPDLSQCVLEIWGMDGSAVMDREEKLKGWPNKKDSDIATEIFDEYGLTPDVEDTGVIHDEAVSTIIQRETDMQFLKRLALRNGYECYVEGETGFFHAPLIDEAPQPTLAVHFGNETNVYGFSIEIDALAPANVSMFQVDRLDKEVLVATSEPLRQTALGASGAADLLGPGVNLGQTYIGMNGATGSAEMAALCQGLYNVCEWFVTGAGEISANEYAHVLKPRKTVTIKGVGETHSGVYYVTHVTHSFSGDGYSQSFRVKRNALMPTGGEDF